MFIRVTQLDQLSPPWKCQKGGNIVLTFQVSGLVAEIIGIFPLALLATRPTDRVFALDATLFTIH
jgi:hypothetical protein